MQLGSSGSHVLSGTISIFVSDALCVILAVLPSNVSHRQLANFVFGDVFFISRHYHLDMDFTLEEKGESGNKGWWYSYALLKKWLTFLFH